MPLTANPSFGNALAVVALEIVRCAVVARQERRVWWENVGYGEERGKRQLKRENERQLAVWQTITLASNRTKLDTIQLLTVYAQGLNWNEITWKASLTALTMGALLGALHTSRNSFNAGINDALQPSVGQGDRQQQQSTSRPAEAVAAAAAAFRSFSLPVPPSTSNDRQTATTTECNWNGRIQDKEEDSHSHSATVVAEAFLFPLECSQTNRNSFFNTRSQFTEGLCTRQLVACGHVNGEVVLLTKDTEGTHICTHTQNNSHSLWCAALHALMCVQQQKLQQHCTVFCHHHPSWFNASQ